MTPDIIFVYKRKKVMELPEVRLLQYEELQKLKVKISQEMCKRMVTSEPKIYKSSVNLGLELTLESRLSKSDAKGSLPQILADSIRMHHFPLFNSINIKIDSCSTRVESFDQIKIF